jgi:diacylglycerol O-acyltransferase
VERVNPVNLFISNVPGPNRPLYYAGGRLLAYYALSAISDGQGLNITVHSFDGQLHFGLLADRELVPDVSRMAFDLGDELDLLHRLLTGEPASPPTASSESGGFPDPAAEQGQRLQPA